MISLLKQDPFNKTVLLVGLSTDEKPTDFFAYKGASIPILNGSMFYEADEGIFYLFDVDSEEWIEQAGGGGGYPEPTGSIEITANGTYNVKRKAQAVVNVPDGVAGFIDRSHVSVSNSEATFVAEYAFYCDASHLKSVHLPAVTQIGQYAFYGCSRLEEIEAPAVEIIGASAFDNSIIKEVSFPVLNSVSDHAFYGCRSLTSFSAPLLSSMGNNAFQSCIVLKNIKLDSLLSVPFYGFYGCSQLEEVDLGYKGSQAHNIVGSAFASCPELKSLILRNTTSIWTLSSTSAFTNTPIQLGTGFIYTPRDLLSSYRNGTNWSMLSPATFRALEDYTVDGTTTGDLDPSKI